MAITVKVYNNTYDKTKNIYVDFVSEFFAESPTTQMHCFKITLPGLKRINDGATTSYKPYYLINDLSTFPLITKQYGTNTAAAYATFNDAINDWIAYLIFGYDSNEKPWGSGPDTYPMDFSI